MKKKEKPRSPLEFLLTEIKETPDKMFSALVINACALMKIRRPYLEVKNIRDLLYIVKMYRDDFYEFFSYAVINEISSLCKKHKIPVTSDLYIQRKEWYYLFINKETLISLN